MISRKCVLSARRFASHLVLDAAHDDGRGDEQASEHGGALLELGGHGRVLAEDVHADGDGDERHAQPCGDVAVRDLEAAKAAVVLAATATLNMEESSLRSSSLTCRL